MPAVPPALLRRAARALFLASACAALASGAACAHGPSQKERDAAEIHYQLGAEALRNGRRDEAMREFEEAARLNPAHAPSQLGRGIVLQFFDRTAEAEQAYRKAIALDPKLPDAHNALGQLLAQTNRQEASLAEFDKALEEVTYPQAFLAHCNKGQALASLGRAGEGLAELRTCLSQAPRYCRGHRELGRLEMALGHTREALGVLQRYTELCGQEPESWFELGLAQLKANDLQRAREAFERCAALPEAPLVQECRDKAEALR